MILTSAWRVRVLCSGGQTGEHCRDLTVSAVSSVWSANDSPQSLPSRQLPSLSQIFSGDKSCAVWGPAHSILPLVLILITHGTTHPWPQ